MTHIHPDPTDLAALVDRYPADTPVVMLNLLRFREDARYPDGTDHTPCSGREAYARYGRVAGAKVAALGGQVLYAGTPWTELIGPGQDRWDQVLVVLYPSVPAFLGMTQDPEYTAATVHRTAALEDSRLVATEPRG